MLLGRKSADPALELAVSADLAVLPIAARRKRERTPKGEPASRELALALEPAPEEMPAIETPGYSADIRAVARSRTSGVAPRQ